MCVCVYESLIFFSIRIISMTTVINGKKVIMRGTSPFLLELSGLYDRLL